MIKSNLTLLFSIMLSTSCFMACKSDHTINMGSGDGGLTVELTDSIKVQASTYLMDSLPTSGTGTILLGAIDDANLGKLNSSSYMQLKTDFGSSTLPEKATFDSLNLVLKYSSYRYGDTMTMQQISVNRLTERIILRKVNGGVEDEERPVFVSSEALYAGSSFAYNPVALGTKTYKPKPGSKDSVLITLDKSLGEEFFKLIVNKDKKITDAEEFQDFFRGIVLRSTEGKSVIGFRADSIKMNMYYKYTSNIDGMAKKGRLSFSLNSPAYQFNHIVADRSNTKLTSLSYQHREVKSDVTENEFYLQSGTGIVAKLQLPGLLEFLKQPKVVVNKLQLIIETKPDTYNTFKAPASLLLFVANKSNTPKFIVKTPFADQSQEAYFQKGDEAGSSGKYVFELGEYANDLRKGLYTNTSLLLSMPLNTLTRTVDRLHIKDGKSKVSIKTKIIYTKY